MNNIYIYGLGQSGEATLKFFLKKKSNIIAWDDNVKKRKSIIKQYPNIILKKINKVKNVKINTAIISPGISFKEPNLKIFFRKNISVYRDLEIFIRNINPKKLIAVTGTNGKSTTVSLIGNLLLKKEKKVFVGGNLNPPLLDSLRTKKFKKYVVELSSFQLEAAPTFESYISVLLNISKDHLDRYKNLKQYSKVKNNIFKNLTKEQYAIIGIDDKYSNSIYKKLNSNSKKIIPISINKYLKSGIYFRKGQIIDNYFKNKPLKIRNHNHINLQNILATYTVAKIFNYGNNSIKSIINNFKSLKHRSEIIYRDKKLLIVNDSKATNISSALESIKKFKEIYLILGGRLKQKKYNQLLNTKNLKKIYIIGESTEYLYNNIHKKIKCEKSLNMKNAVKNSLKDTYKNKFSTILLAPACASFDQYTNFEQRGKHFVTLVKKYNRKNNIK